MRVRSARLAGGYFWYFATLGLFVPYWPPYLAARGFDAVQIGLAMGVFAAMRVVGPPAYAHLADASGRPLALLRTAALAAAVAMLAFPWLGTLWAVALLLALYSALWNGVMSVYDAYVLTRHGGPSRYGALRLWGSVGFVVTAVAGGGWYAAAPVTTLPFALATLIGLTWLTLRSLTDGPLAGAATQPASPPRVLAPLLKDRRVLAFLAVAFLMLFSHGAYYNFFSLYLADLGYDGVMIGALWAWAVIAEIGVFMLAPRLLAAHSLRGLTVAALAATCLRWALLAACADSLPLLVVAQALHMMSFGLFHLCAVSLAQVLFPAGAAARGQALHGSVGYGLGGMAGAVASGWLWREAGPAPAFWVASAAAALAAVIAALGLPGPAGGPANRAGEPVKR